MRDQLGEPFGLEPREDERGDRESQRREDPALHSGERGEGDRVQEQATGIEWGQAVLRAVGVRRRDAAWETGGTRRVEDLAQVVGCDLHLEW